MNVMNTNDSSEHSPLISAGTPQSADLLAADAVSRRDWSAAEHFWREAIRLKPTIWQYQFALSTALRRLGRTEEARNLLVAICNEFPNEATPWSGLAQLAEQQAEWEQAEEHWRRFLAIDNRPAWALIALARVLRMQKQFETASAVLDGIEKRFPTEASLFVEYARIAQDQRNWLLALDRWQAIETRFPDVWEGIGGQIAALTALGRPGEAQSVLERAAPRFPNHAGALHALAASAERQNEWESAENYWRRLLAVAPEIGWVQMGLARTLDAQQKYNEAEAVRKSVVSLLPDDLNILTELCRRAESQRDWPMALKHWQNVRSRFPKLLTAYIGQATALAELNRLDDAEAVLAAATLAFPNELQPGRLLVTLKRRRAAGLPSDLPVRETEPFETVVRANNGKGYLTPTTLRVTAQPTLRIAMVGSCQLSGWQLPLAAPKDTIFEEITVNNMASLPGKSTEEIAAIDFMLIQMPIRAILYDGALWGLSYDDIHGFQRVFDMCCSRIDQMLENWMTWNAEHGLLTFVANFLVPQDTGMGRLFPRYDLRNTQYFVERLNEHLERTVRSSSNAYLFDVDRIVASLGKRFIQDDAVEFISHGSVMPMPGETHDRMEPVPPLGKHYDIDWPDRFGPAVWAELLAMYRSVRQIDPVKLVVVDLDDTLWKGVSGDMTDLDPSEMLGFWPMGFAESLTWLKKRGILLAILSKNDQSRIREIFPKIYGRKLPLSEFAAVMVNWRPKTENMAELLETMSLLQRNVVFIDDNPVERAAMQAAFPEMRILGRYPYYLRRTLLWSAETQVASVTIESGRRTEMIQRQFEREGKRRVMQREDFLQVAAPQVKLSQISSVDHPRFDRVMELINKTNQFNTTGRRWRHEELHAVLNAGGLIYAFEVSDSFTAYGLVGAVLTQGRSIVQWAMSCRVLGYQIEQAVMARILQLTPETEQRISGTLIETAVNFPCRSLFSSCGFTQQDTEWLLAEGAQVSAPDHVTVQVVS